MEEFKLVLSLMGTTLGLLITTLTFLLKYIKSSKVKKAAQNLVDFSSTLLRYIEEAEQMIHYTGKEKKAYVMTKATQYLLNHNMTVKAEKISENIEEFIELTKKVNVSKTESLKELKKLYD